MRVSECVCVRACISHAHIHLHVRMCAQPPQPLSFLHFPYLQCGASFYVFGNSLKVFSSKDCDSLQESRVLRGRPVLPQSPLSLSPSLSPSLPRTQTHTQVKTHAQKYFLKLARQSCENGGSPQDEGRRGGKSLGQSDTVQSRWGKAMRIARKRARARARARRNRCPYPRFSPFPVDREGR